MTLGKVYSMHLPKLPMYYYLFPTKSGIKSVKYIGCKDIILLSIPRIFKQAKKKRRRIIDNFKCQRR